MEKIFSKINKEKRGFTLIEIMISVSLFVTILVISSGAIYSIFDANRKSQSLRTVMDNLNYTLESMTKTIRFGYSYHCDESLVPWSSPLDCVAGATSIVFKDYLGVETIYDSSGSSIRRSVDGGTTYSNLTSTEVTITSLKFYVYGSTVFCSTTCGSRDVVQPRVVVYLSGYVGARPTSRSSFNLQTTVSQRTVDAKD